MFEYLGDGLLRSGAGVKITTQIPAEDLEQGDYFAVAGCRDVNNVFHAWSATGSTANSGTSGGDL